MILGTMEASRTVVAVPTFPVDVGRPEVFGDEAIFFEEGGMDATQFDENPDVMIGTAAGPTGLAFVDGKPYVYGFLARTVTELDYQRIDDAIGEQVLNADFPRTWFTQPTVELPASQLPEDVLKGRSLFYSSTKGKMAADGSGVSCSTCHLDGRNDGLTWQFPEGARQTPSLAGMVSSTAPVTWTQTVESVAMEAMITSERRMGGSSLPESAAASIQAFVDSTPDADVEQRGATTEAVRLGEEIFNRPEVGCATCHTAPLYTNNKSYPMFGEVSVNTPSLIGVAATAPYIHDGSARSLRDVIELSRTGVMGDTSSLTNDEMTALETFLRSL